MAILNISGRNIQGTNLYVQSSDKEGNCVARDIGIYYFYLIV